MIYCGKFIPIIAFGGIFFHFFVFCLMKTRKKKQRWNKRDIYVITGFVKTDFC